MARLHPLDSVSFSWFSKNTSSHPFADPNHPRILSKAIEIIHNSSYRANFVLEIWAKKHQFHLPLPITPSIPSLKLRIQRKRRRRGGQCLSFRGIIREGQTRKISSWPILFNWKGARRRSIDRGGIVCSLYLLGSNSAARSVFDFEIALRPRSILLEGHQRVIEIFG